MADSKINEFFSKVYPITDGTKYISVFFYGDCGYVSAVMTGSEKSETGEVQTNTQRQVITADDPSRAPANASVGGSLLINVGKMFPGRPAVIDLTFVNISNGYNRIAGYGFYENNVLPGGGAAIIERETGDGKEFELGLGQTVTINLVFSIVT